MYITNGNKILILIFAMYQNYPLALISISYFCSLHIRQFSWSEVGSYGGIDPVTAKETL